MKNSAYRYRAVFVVIALVLTCLAALSEPVMHPETDYESKSRIADDSRLERLIDNPTRILLEVTSWRDGEFYLIRSETDFHVVIPEPVDRVLSVLLDYEGAKSNYSRVRDSAVVKSSDDPYGNHCVRFEVAIRVLGFGDDYTYLLDNWFDRSEDEGYIQSYALIESIDDKMYELLGNWYVQEVVVNGEKYAYVRSYTILGVKKGSLAMEIAMKAFGALSVKQQIRQLARASKKS